MMEHVSQLQPRSVLDVGVGYGKWGFLVRETLDWLENRRERDLWQTKIVGVEAYDGYSSPLYDWVYDEIIYDDVAHYVQDMPGYDLVILGDVVEHFTKDEGNLLLDSLLSKCRNVLISTPVDFYTQEIEGNPWEAHKSLWRIADFRRFGAFDYEVHGHTAVVALLAGVGASHPTARDRRLSEIAYRMPGMTHQGVLARLAKQMGRRLLR